MKRVFILGAGSSMGHSKGIFPTIDTFFKVAQSGNLGIDLAGEYKGIVDYIKDRTGRNLLKKPDAFDIEVLFTYLEIELERTASPELIKIREQLLGFIQRVLLGLSNKLKSKDSDFQKFRDHITDDDTVITFNWDLLLDNVFDRLHILEGLYKEDKEIRGVLKSHYHKFIFDFSAFSENTYKHAGITPPYTEWNQGHGYYLKMHGSIDWFHCSNNQCRACLKTFPLLELERPHFCSECHEPLKCLIIPPVLNKGYRQYPLIRRIWNVAAKELSATEEVIIWGYSLPPTDFYASWLLSQARQAPLKRLTIINPSVVKGKKKIMLNHQFIDRFSEIFRNKLRSDSICLYENYSDYENRKQVYSKHSIKPKNL